jgi:hypothetical protein
MNVRPDTLSKNHDTATVLLHEPLFRGRLVRLQRVRLYRGRHELAHGRFLYLFAGLVSQNHWYARASYCVLLSVGGKGSTISPL